VIDRVLSAITRDSLRKREYLQEIEEEGRGFRR
jgi:hypothetical protein